MPIDRNAFGWQMMCWEQGPQLALGQDDVHERETLYAAGASHLLEMEQGNYGACWEYL